MFWIRVPGVAALSVAVAVMSRAGTPASRSEFSQTAPACSTWAGPSKRLELPDSRIVSIDVRSMAHSASMVLAVGRLAYVFPASAGPRTPPQLPDSILGVTIDGRGAVALVPNPSLPARVFHPRVAAAPNGRFHVLWVTGLDSVVDLPEPTDTATLWHATYGNGGWSTPVRVMTVRGARLNPELASALLARDDELAVVFPFVERRSALAEGGAILLRRRAGRWLADTLRTTHSAPVIVRALYRREGLISLLTFTDTAFGRSEALYLSKFDEGWSRPVRIAGDGTRPVTIPALVQRDNDYVVSWIEWRWLDPETAKLEWMVMDSAGRSMARGHVDSGPPTYPYELAMVGEHHPLWLYRGTPRDNLVALAVLLDSTIARLPSVGAPFRNPLPATLSLSRNRFLLFTQKLALTDSEPMAASFVTEFEVRCPGSGRR
jgi:hypothetical protein